MLRISEFILNFVLNSAWQIAAIFAVAALRVVAVEEWTGALSSCALDNCARCVSLIVPLLTTTRVVPAWICKCSNRRSLERGSAGKPSNTSGSRNDLDTSITSAARRQAHVNDDPTHRPVSCVRLLAFHLPARLSDWLGSGGEKNACARSATRAGLAPEYRSSGTSVVANCLDSEMCP